MARGIECVLAPPFRAEKPAAKPFKHGYSARVYREIKVLRRSDPGQCGPVMQQLRLAKFLTQRHGASMLDP